MQRWEYQMVYHYASKSAGPLMLKEEADEDLAALGEAGWELVGVQAKQSQGDTDGFLFVFKRPKE